MSAQTEHGRLLAHAARARLRPLGVVQKGRSRGWRDDRGWWTINIEFQPSSWGRGSYLNFGVQYLWERRDFVTLGIRDQEFVEFESPDQFASQADRLATRAADFIVARRTALSDMSAHAAALEESDNLWAAFSAGIARGLLGERQHAHGHLMEVLAVDSHAPWVDDAKHSAEQVMERLGDALALERWVLREVVATRELQRLPLAPDLTDRLRRALAIHRTS